MTINACTDNLRVIDELIRQKSLREFVVAGIAGVTGVDVIGGFAERGHVVVTTNTVPNEGGVIGHIGTRDIKPVYRVMTGIAFSACRDVVNPLTARQCAVMTTGAATNGLSVIHRCRV